MVRSGTRIAANAVAQMVAHRAIRRHADVGATCEQRLLVECDQDRGAPTLVNRDGAVAFLAADPCQQLANAPRLPLPPAWYRDPPFIESVRNGPQRRYAGRL